MREVKSPLVVRYEKWYANRPDYVERMTDRAQRYLHFIVEEVEKRGMPMEIALLPMIESAFNPEAYSVARASGIWNKIYGSVCASDASPDADARNTNLCHNGVRPSATAVASTSPLSARIGTVTVAAPYRDRLRELGAKRSDGSAPPARHRRATARCRASGWHAGTPDNASCCARC